MEDYNLNTNKHTTDISWAQPNQKLRIPIIPRQFLERPRLRWRFDDALNQKVTVVAAPAGYGKTVFLSQALASANRQVAWLSLDKRDNYLIRFWVSFIMSIQKVQPGLGDHALTLLWSKMPPIEPILAELVNEIDEAVPDLIIVLDDYHEINVQAIHDSVTFLIDYLPPQVRLFISSRVDPPLPLARLRGRGHLAEIKASDLQFTQEEAYSFLNEVMGLSLSRKLVDSLHDRTEGWVAGLQMAAVSVRGHRNAAEYIPVFKGTNKEIIEYLNQEVLEQQEEHVRIFLLQTCILGSLSESICKAVTRRDDCQQILEQLVANNLFLQPLDDEDRWFRYHQLFSDVLYKQLETTWPDIIPSLHSRAIEWYQSQGLIEDAIEHILAVKDFERAADLMQNVVFKMLGQDKHNKIRNWVSRLPEELIAKNLQICIVGALICEPLRIDGIMGELCRQYVQLITDTLEISGQIGSGEAETAKGFLVLVKSVNEYYNGNLPETISLLSNGLNSLPVSETRANCCLTFALGAAYWYTGALEEACQSLEESIRLSKLARYFYITILSSTALAHIKFARGQLNIAAETCRKAINVGTDSDGRELPVTCYTRLLLGEILYQQNFIDESKDNVTRAVTLGSQVPDPVLHLNSDMALARIAFAQGDSDTAIAIAHRARTTYQADVGQSYMADVFMTRLLLMMDNLTEAHDYAHIWPEFLSTSSNQPIQTDPSFNLIRQGICGGDFRDIWAEIPLLTSVRLRLAQGKLQGLFDLLEDTCQEAEKKGLGNILIESLILKALVLYAQGKLSRALGILSDVLAMAEKEGYVRSFVDEGALMYQLLHRAASRCIIPYYVSRLISAFNMPDLDITSQTKKSKKKGRTSSRQAEGFGFITEPPTEREIEVLELVAAGLSNRDIANELFIALPTVRNYLHNIYGKLDVNNRVHAVRRAQEIGLLKASPSKIIS